MTTSRSKTIKKANPKKRKIPKDIREQCLKSFQKLRRVEEANEDGNVRCISCGKVLSWKEAQGGHYISRRNRATELESDNIWPQCPQCNGYLRGNVINYRMRLVRKIGEERVARIENLAASSKGDEISTEALSLEDRVKAVQKKNATWYLEKKKEFDKRVTELIKEKGL